MITEYAQKIVRFCMRGFCVFPIQNNRIIFNSQKGTQYACSPRYIYEYLVQKYGDQLQYVWCLQNPSSDLKKRKTLRIVSYNSLKYFYYQMTSKVIVSNIPTPCYVPRREKQYMVNTWHGGGAYKKFGTSVPRQISLSDMSNKIIKTAEASDNVKWEWYKAYYNALDTSIFLSSCKRFTQVAFESQMIPRQSYREIGMPRNDIFFKDYKNIGDQAKRRLGIDLNKKVILFAPTYRGNVKNQQYNMKLNVPMCINAAKERWGGDWVFVFRMHVLSNSIDKENIPKELINASKYEEMQELLCMADVFITDYSSSQWDYALTKKPAFLFTPDLEYYLNDDRGFYTPIEDWPFPYARTNDELSDLIRNFDEKIHREKVQRHFDLLGSFERGNATEVVCNDIISHIQL